MSFAEMIRLSAGVIGRVDVVVDVLLMGSFVFGEEFVVLVEVDIDRFDLARVKVDVDEAHDLILLVVDIGFEADDTEVSQLAERCVVFFSNLFHHLLGIDASGGEGRHFPNYTEVFGCET